MKTLVVLSALASLAVAAPALQGVGAPEYQLSESKFPEAVKREKKSPLPDVGVNTSQAPGTTVNSPTPRNSNSEATGRSFGLKKPIIIKKKVGYHLYRSSDEEQAQADSQESCRQQVKVKLCDDENNTKSNASTNEDPNVHMTEHKMKHSLQLAKEAVENLQRDLIKIEQKPSIKSASCDQRDSQSDVEMHEDIEVARQALEHIHKNFGNLESMSLHATTAKDAENVHDVQFTIAKTEEERMAQWKEAIDNIHKNVEIAKNIEDTFKSDQANDQASFIKTNDTEKNANFPGKIEKEKMRTSENTHSKEVGTCDDDQILKLKNKSTQEKSSDKITEKLKMAEGDMKTSASTITEAKVHDPVDQKTLLEKSTVRNTPEPVTQSNDEKKHRAKNNNQQDKSAELESNTSTPQLLHENRSSMKTTEDEVETNPETKELLSKNKMKSSESDTLFKNQRDSGVTLNKSVENVETFHDDNKNKKNVKTDLGNEQVKAAVDTTMHMKSVEHTGNESEDTPLTETKTQEKSAHNVNSSKNLEKSNIKAIDSSSKSADPMKIHTTHFTDLKAAPSTNMERQLVDASNKHHQISGPSDMRWAQEKNEHLDQTVRMKAAEVSKNDFHDMDHLRNMHFTDPPHHNPTVKNSHNFDTLEGQGFLAHNPGFHDSAIAHEKSAHMNSLTQSDFHMTDAVSEFGPENHMFRWKPPHESARTVYGSGPAIGGGAGGGAAGGGGALGVFPNANIGSCGIPLLLSCSPSVVSGSLAKAHPAGYAAPAYRTEDDFNFLTKRDVKKTNEIPATKVQRTPANIKLKTKVLDTKH